MQCPNGCSELMSKKRIDQIFYRDNTPIVISDLTVFVCSNCGHISMPLVSAKKVEEILNGNKTPTGKFIAELYKVESV